MFCPPRQPCGEPGGRPDWETAGGVERPARPGALHGQLPVRTEGEAGPAVREVGRALSDDPELPGQRQPHQLPFRPAQAWPDVQTPGHVQVYIEATKDDNIIS